MEGMGDTAYRLWYEHVEKGLVRYTNIRDFLFALAQEKKPRQGGAEGETHVLQVAHVFTKLPEHELVVFLAIIESALGQPGGASSAMLGEVDAQCKKLAAAAIVAWAGNDAGAAATLVQQQEVQNRAARRIRRRAR